MTARTKGDHDVVAQGIGHGEEPIPSPAREVSGPELATGRWEAEPEHQDYLERRPDGYTCHFIRPDWKLPVRAKALQDT